MKPIGFTTTVILLTLFVARTTTAARAAQSITHDASFMQDHAAGSRSASTLQERAGLVATVAARLEQSPLVKAAQPAALYRPLEKITQFEDELNWINETRTRREYDAGLLVRRHEDVWNGGVIGDWQPFMVYQYTYAPDGTLASETVLEWNSGEMRHFERTLYENDNGVFTRILVQAPTGTGLWVDVEQTTYTLEDGLVVAGQTDQWLGEWTPVERFTYEESDNSVIETIQRPDGSGWMNAERTIFPGLNLYFLHKAIEQFVGELADLEGMFYAIRPPELITQNWNGTEWVNELRIDVNTSYQGGTFYTIDETRVTEEWNGIAWVATARVVIEYVLTHELNGLPARLSLQVHDGGEWVEFGSETYILQVDARKIVQSTLSLDLGSGMEEVSRVRLEWIFAPSLGVDDPVTPATFALDQNFPNPFNPSTRITYSLTQGQSVRLSVFDMLGRRVALLDSGVRPVGEHSVTWDASGMPSGMYLYRLETDSGVATHTMTLLK